MANARTKNTRKTESLEELQKQRTQAYFQMGDKSYHIKVLETDVLNLAGQISSLNKTISEMMKSKEKEDASKKLEDPVTQETQPNA